MRDEQSLALFAFVRSQGADRYLFLPRLLSSGRAVKHFAEINRRNRLRVSDYLASTLAREKFRASASMANCCVHPSITYSLGPFGFFKFVSRLG
jgi:hypothetical protein